jgi:hypothetical protein
MTKLLQQAFEEASKLPEADQNAFAQWVLEELESEKRWERSFGDSEDVLEMLADEALREKRAGKTKPLDLKCLGILQPRITRKMKP